MKVKGIKTVTNLITTNISTSSLKIEANIGIAQWQIHKSNKVGGGDVSEFQKNASSLDPIFFTNEGRGCPPQIHQCNQPPPFKINRLPHFLVSILSLLGHNVKYSKNQHAQDQIQMSVLDSNFHFHIKPSNKVKN